MSNSRMMAIDLSEVMSRLHNRLAAPPEEEGSDYSTMVRIENKIDEIEKSVAYDQWRLIQLGKLMTMVETNGDIQEFLTLMDLVHDMSLEKFVEGVQRGRLPVTDDDGTDG